MDSIVENYITETFQRFRLLRKTNRSEVWLAGMSSGAVVVFKRIYSDGLPYKLLESNPQPLWPKILYCVEEPGETIIVEEYIPGVSLQNRLEGKAFLTEAEALSILCQLCDGLIVLHGLGIIHRDIKPSNLILMDEGTIRLIDFDAARLQKENRDEDTTRLGTKGYAPPEQFGYGQTDARSDIYALGITMEKLLGPDYHGILVTILDRCRELDPKHRYNSAQELKKAIQLRAFWGKWKKYAMLSVIPFAATGVYFFSFTNTSQNINTPQAEQKVPVLSVEDRNVMPEDQVISSPMKKKEPIESRDVSDSVAIEPLPQTEYDNREIDESVQTLENTKLENMIDVNESESSASRHFQTPDEEAEAFLALFKDNPEKLEYWRIRKDGYFKDIERQNLSPKEKDEAKREAVDLLRRGELGLRAEAFQKTIPKNLTMDEKGRIFNEFVFKQIEILGITDW